MIRKTMTIALEVQLVDMTDDELSVHISRLEELLGDAENERQIRYDSQPEEEPSDGMTDAEADADTLRSAGYGTDEDYGGAHDPGMDHLERDHNEGPEDN